MVKHEPELHTQRLGGTTGARQDEGPDDEGGALAQSPG